MYGWRGHSRWHLRIARTIVHVLLCTLDRQKNPFFSFGTKKRWVGRSLLDFIWTHIGIYLGWSSQCATGNRISITIAHCRCALQDKLFRGVIRVIMLIKPIHALSRIRSKRTRLENLVDEVQRFNARARKRVCFSWRTSGAHVARIIYEIMRRWSWYQAARSQDRLLCHVHVFVLYR